MTIEILENNLEGYDDEELCTLHNIEVIPSKGDQIVINSKFYIVEGFLWHIEDKHLKMITIWVDYDVEKNC